MDRALLTRVEKQAWFHRYPRGWPLLLFLLTSIGTVVSVMAIEHAEAERRQLELDRNITEIASGLQRRASENIAILTAGAALFETRQDVSREAFMEFAANLHGSNDYHGSMGMGWARWLPAPAVAPFEVATREEEDPDFLVYPRPSAQQRVAVPIVYIDPVTPANSSAIGFDMYSQPARRLAMETAIRLRQPVASGMVHLVQDAANPGTAGFLIFMPVFQWEGGRRTIKGFVYSPFRAEEFLDSAAEYYRTRRVEIAIYDGAREPDRLLAWRQLPGENGMSMSRRITIAHRDWLLRVSVKKPKALSTLSRATLMFGAILALLVMAIARLITKRAAEDRQVLEWLSRQSAIRNSLTRELNHRVKNTLANVLSIVSLTRRRATGIDEFAESLAGRLRALSATHDLLSQSDWSNAPLVEIVRSELAPYMADDDSHVEMSGPEVSLAPNDALSLGLAIHELATNAAKYGALSTVAGRVFITWRMLSPELVEVCWREEGGPPVREPDKRGFGRDLIEKIVAHELQSEVDLRFLPGGVQCRLQVPVRKLNDFMLRQTRGH